MTYSFSYLELVCCSISSSNCCFLTCIQISQEAGQVVWYYHLFEKFPQFVVIHTVKGFAIVNKAEIDVFLELSCFFDDPTDVHNLISDSTAFSKSSLNMEVKVLIARKVCFSFSVVSDSLQPRGQLSRLLCPWNSLGKYTGVGCHFLLQGIFPTQGLNLGLLHEGKLFTF